MACWVCVAKGQLRVRWFLISGDPNFNEMRFYFKT